jgi:DNA-binding transcriptional regulator YiaG
MGSVSTPRPSPERIVLARKHLGLKQNELAQELGCSVFTIGKWERGERSPGPLLMRRLAAKTKKPVEWFYIIDEEVAVA